MLHNNKNIQKTIEINISSLFNIGIINCITDFYITFGRKSNSIREKFL